MHDSAFYQPFSAPALIQINFVSTQGVIVL